MGVLEIAGDLASASGAFAGLTLVFVGFAVSSFDSYDDSQKRSVRWRYRLRIWPILLGFILSITSTGSALIAKAACDASWAWGSVVLLGLAAIATTTAAIIVALDVG